MALFTCFLDHSTLRPALDFLQKLKRSYYMQMVCLHTFITKQTDQNDVFYITNGWHNGKTTRRTVDE